MVVEVSRSDLGDRLRIACEIAREAGDFALKCRTGLAEGNMSVTTKGPQDFVTQYDTDTEHLIRDRLAEAFPSEAILGEEKGGVTDHNLSWVIDPIDGTSNYIRDLDHWGVSIALTDGQSVLLGVVYDVPRRALYSAALGQGAAVNGQALQSNRPSPFESAIVILGVSRRTPLQDYLDLHAHLHNAGIEHRRYGSAAVGMCRVAEGSADAYYEADLNAWDALAGLLIVSETGGIAKSCEIPSFLTSAGPVLCGSSELADYVEQGLPSSVQAQLHKLEMTEASRTDASVWFG